MCSGWIEFLLSPVWKTWLTPTPLELCERGISATVAPSGTWRTREDSLRSRWRRKDLKKKRNWRRAVIGRFLLPCSAAECSFVSSDLAPLLWHHHLTGSGDLPDPNATLSIKPGDTGQNELSIKTHRWDRCVCVPRSRLSAAGLWENGAPLYTWSRILSFTCTQTDMWETDMQTNRQVRDR